MSRSARAPAGLFDSRKHQSHLSEGQAISGALKAVFGENPPCTTRIGVPSLAREEFLIEVEPSVVFLPGG